MKQGTDLSSASSVSTSVQQQIYSTIGLHKPHMYFWSVSKKIIRFSFMDFLHPLFYTEKEYFQLDIRLFQNNYDFMYYVSS